MHDETNVQNGAPPVGYDLLVVDDDMVQRTIISRLGGQAGFIVTAVPTYEEASTLLQSRRFDCITLDLGLGERSGALLLPLIARLGYRIPVVVISGADEQLLEAMSVMSHSLQIDAEVCAKPLNLRGLRETLTKYRTQASTTRGLRQTG